MAPSPIRVLSRLLNAGGMVCFVVLPTPGADAPVRRRRCSIQKLNRQVPKEHIVVLLDYLSAVSQRPIERIPGISHRNFNPHKLSAYIGRGSLLPNRERRR